MGSPCSARNGPAETRPHLGDHIEQGRMQVAVRCGGLVTVEAVWRPREIGHMPAGLLDDQATRRRVPRMELPLPEGVEAPAGDVAQVQGGRSGKTHALRPADRVLQEREVEGGVPATVVWEPRAEQSLLEAGHGGHADRRTVETSTGAPERAEGLLAERVVDEPEKHLILAPEGDRDRKLWISVREVGRAVERIDVPEMPVATGTRG